MKTISLGKLGAAIGSFALAGTTFSQVTTRVSLATDGSQLAGHCVGGSISADGRLVAFVRTITPQDADVFVRDRVLGTTELASEAMGGGPGNARSGVPAISADGRYVAFSSEASDLVQGDSNGTDDVFVRDLATGGIERVNLGIAGAEADDFSGAPSISADGRFVAFHSEATNLVPGDTNGVFDVFVRDRLTGTTERASVSGAGVQGNTMSLNSSISLDGRWVVFESSAWTLAPGDTNSLPDVFLRDRLLDLTELVSVATGGAQGNFASFGGSVSANGQLVAFGSGASNLASGDTNGTWDVFVRNRSNQTTELVSAALGGIAANGASHFPRINADGRFVAFYGSASNLVPGDTNGTWDVFVRDLRTGMSERASIASHGTEGIGASTLASVSADGRFVAFQSEASNLVGGDTNSGHDVFVHDRAASGFESLCDAGAGSVIACPCSNPPAAPGLGCDNSAATGGAALSASGAAYLSMDSLVFQTTGEKPTALSILLQGSQRVASGIVFGQGVRCLRGTLKRLYAKLASGGGITAPDIGSGEPAVSVRSAALGDPLQPGSRYYLVYYRDPAVLGGCPATSTFNATQTGRVTWWR